MALQASQGAFVSSYGDSRRGLHLGIRLMVAFHGGRPIRLEDFLYFIQFRALYASGDRWVWRVSFRPRPETG